MQTSDITIIDYGVGNLLSVQRGFEYCGATVTLSSDPEIILSADRVVLPGVGAFGNAMQALKQLGLVDTLREVALLGIPLLGICLGMQLMLEESDEFGFTAGLGLIPGRVVAIPSKTVSGEPHKVPHIGWSALKLSATACDWSGTVLENTRPDEAAYFVHSYMSVPSNSDYLIAECAYGGHLIPAVIKRDHVTGCQFHPEKSGEVGLKILRAFMLQ
jgi:imidazole glycerol-phosphate synthase subunit HisH